MLEGPGLLQELLPRPRPTRPREVLLEQTWSLWEDGGLRLPALPGVRRRLWSLSAAKGDRAGSPVLGASPSRTPRLVLSGALTRAAGTAARKATGLETRTRSPRTHTRSVRTLSPTPQGGAARCFALWLFSRSRHWFLSSGELCVLHRGDPGESLGGCLRLDRLRATAPEVHGDGRSGRGLASLLSGLRVGGRPAGRLLSLAGGCRWAPSSWALHLCVSGSVCFPHCLIFMLLGAFLLCVEAIIQWFLYIYRERECGRAGGGAAEGGALGLAAKHGACPWAPSRDPAIMA